MFFEIKWSGINFWLRRRFPKEFELVGSLFLSLDIDLQEDLTEIPQTLSFLTNEIENALKTILGETLR